MTNMISEKVDVGEEKDPALYNDILDYNKRTTAEADLQKAAAIAGKFGQKDLQEKLLELARQARASYIRDERRRRNPVEQPPLSWRDKGKIVAKTLREDGVFGR